MEVLLPPSKISTLITTAIRAGDAESLGRALTWQSTDLNIADEQGCFPLMAAIDVPSKDRLLIVKLLLENGADPSTNGAILHEVLAGAYFDKEKKLKTLNYSNPAESLSKILEIETFRVEVALLLLQYGAKIDALSCTDQNIFAYQAPIVKHQLTRTSSYTSTSHMFGSISSSSEGSSPTDVAFQLANHYLSIKKYSAVSSLYIQLLETLGGAGAPTADLLAKRDAEGSVAGSAALPPNAPAVELTEATDNIPVALKIGSQ
jgi:hypothetical protein